MTAKNDVTGDKIKTKVSNRKAYEAGWEKIFGKKTKLKSKLKRNRK